MHAVDAGSTAVYSEDVETVSTLPLDEENLTLALEAYDARIAQAIAERVAMGSGSGNEVLRAFANLPVLSEAIEKTVASLETKETADFGIMNLLRLLQSTSELNDLIIPTLKKALAWPEEGNSKTQYKYWSENHGLMWHCAITLTRVVWMASATRA
jgi:hypothetical protein